MTTATNMPLDSSLMAQGTGGLLGGLLPLFLIMIIMYVLLILPAQRRQKKLNAMIGALKAGDKVITNGGLYGVIVGVEGDSVQLRIAEQVKVKVAKSAIAGMQPEAKESSSGA